MLGLNMQHLTRYPSGGCLDLHKFERAERDLTVKRVISRQDMASSRVFPSTFSLLSTSFPQESRLHPILVPTKSELPPQSRLEQGLIHSLENTLEARDLSHSLVNE